MNKRTFKKQSVLSLSANMTRTEMVFKMLAYSPFSHLMWLLDRKFYSV